MKLLRFGIHTENWTCAACGWRDVRTNRFQPSIYPRIQFQEGDYTQDDDPKPAHLRVICPVCGYYDLMGCKQDGPR